MFKNPVNLFLISIFLYPILKGFLFKFSSDNLKRDISGIESNICFIIALFVGTYWTKKVFFHENIDIYRYIYDAIPNEAINYINEKPFIIYILIIPIIVFIVYKIMQLIINIINKLALYPAFDGIEKFLKKRETIFNRIVGALFQLPRSICYILFLGFSLNFLSMMNLNSTFEKYLQSSNCYNYVCRQMVVPITNSQIAKRLPSIINNSFKVVIKEDTSRKLRNTNNKGVTVYYNGVTIEEGVKSNSTINSFSKRLVNKNDTTREKAKKIYNWIGKNISYDNNKAKKVLEDDLGIKSGAIPTFVTKRGICFDYSCLYVAMCRANHIKVRLITGEGFNGIGWINHAWNQVYIPEQSKWINVDTTFFKGGNYFDTIQFQMDHRNAKVAGEW